MIEQLKGLPSHWKVGCLWHELVIHVCLLKVKICTIPWIPLEVKQTCGNTTPVKQNCNHCLHFTTLLTTINGRLWLKSKSFQTGIDYFIPSCFLLHPKITGYVYFPLTCSSLDTFILCIHPVFNSASPINNQCSYEEHKPWTK